MSRSRLTPLPIGATLGGLTILARLNDAVIADERVYRVRYQCCGHVAELNYSAIRQRARKNHFNCLACAQAQRPKPPPQQPAAPVIEPRPTGSIPSAAALLALWDAANARVGARQGARG